MRINSIFDWLNHITLYKTPINQFSEEDWDKFNAYMVHRFISMQERYIDLVNFVQKINPQEKQQIYQIYCNLIPKQKTYFKYQKSSNKEVNKEFIKILTDYFNLSQREVLEYNKILQKEDKIQILKSLGFDDKEIKKLIK